MNEPVTNAELYSVNYAANACNVSRSTILRLEKEGLVLPAYTDPQSGYRYYSVENLAEILHILHLQSLGFTKKELTGIKDQPARFRRALEARRAEQEALLRELEDLTSRISAPNTIRVRRIDLPACSYYVQQKQLLHTPENLRSFALSSYDRFVSERLHGSNELPMLLHPTDLGRTHNGRFDGQSHMMRCLIPAPGSRHRDVLEQPGCTAFQLVCRCDYNDSSSLFARLRESALQSGLTPSGAVFVAGLPELFFGADSSMRNATLRLILRTDTKS